MATCSICNKRPQFGHNRSHSLRATKRKFKPNIVKRKMIVNGEPKSVYMCTRCLRTQTKLRVR